MDHDINDLRDHLFATLAALRDKDAPMDIERAKAVADVAARIIDSARVEVSFMKEVGGRGSGFIPDQPKGPARLADASEKGALAVARRRGA